LLSIFITWVVLFLFFFGIGLLTIRFFKSTLQVLLQEFPNAFWIGWATTIVILQLWHFLLPISGITFIFIGILSLIGWVVSIPTVVPLIRSLRPIPVIYILISSMLVGLWLSNMASSPNIFYDTALYHQQVIQWNSNYPIVPGLGLLHDRFGFNSSGLLYQSLMDVWVWKGKSFHIANGLLLWVLTYQAITGAYKFFSTKEFNAYYLYYLLFLIPTLLPDGWNPFTFPNVWSIVSNGQDMAVFVLGIVLISALLLFIKTQKNDGNDRALLVYISLLAATGVVIRLSFGITAIVTLIIAGLVWLRRYGIFSSARKIHSPLLLSSSLILLTIIPWMIRNVILSGHLIYPSTSFPFPVEWRVPDYIILNTRNWIFSWARRMHVHWGEIFYSLSWLPDWFTGLQDLLVQQLNIILVVGLVGCMIWSTDPRMQRSKIWVVALVPSASLVFWFMMAPDPRFAGSSFWALIILLVVWIIEMFAIGKPVDFDLRLAASLLFIGFFVYINPVSTNNIMPYIWDVAPMPEYLKRINNEYRELETNSGAQINAPPAGTDQCWQAPIPCTPYFNPYLQLRVPGQLRYGFVLDPLSPLPNWGGFNVKANLTVAVASGWDSQLHPQTQGLVMQNEAKLAIISLENQLVTIGLEAAEIYEADVQIPKAKIRVFHNGKTFDEVVVRVGEKINLDIYLPKGSHVIMLDLVKTGDRMPTSIVFYPLEILQSNHKVE